MLPAPPNPENSTVTPQVTVEFLIERLQKLHEYSLPNGPLLVPVASMRKLDQISGLTREELAFLLHSLEEKKMTNWIINGLENEKAELESKLEQEKHFHLDTLVHLEKVSPPSSKTLLQEQFRLRKALHNSEFQLLKNENDFLKNQISQFTADLFQAQTSIQALRGPSDHAEIIRKHQLESENVAKENIKLKESFKEMMLSFSESLAKFQEQLREKDGKIIELEAINSGNEQIMKDLGSLQDNFNIQEFELECLKTQMKLKDQNIDDLEEHLRNIEEDSRIAETYQSFIDKNVEKDHKKVIEILNDKHEKAIFTMQKSLNKVKEDLKIAEKELATKTEQPDHAMASLVWSHDNLKMENEKLKNKLGMLKMKHELCPNPEKFGQEKAKLEKKIEELERQLLKKVFKMRTMEEDMAAKDRASLVSKPARNGQSPAKIGQAQPEEPANRLSNLEALQCTSEPASLVTNPAKASTNSASPIENPATMGQSPASLERNPVSPSQNPATNGQDQPNLARTKALLSGMPIDTIARKILQYQHELLELAQENDALKDQNCELSATQDFENERLKNEIVGKDQLNQMYSDEYSKLLVTLNEREKELEIQYEIVADLKSKFADLHDQISQKTLQTNMKISQFKYELTMAKRELKEKIEEIGRLKDQIGDAASDGGWEEFGKEEVEVAEEAVEERN